MARWIQDVTLRGAHVMLEPLNVSHIAGLGDAAADGELWKLWFTSIPPPGATETYVEQALLARQEKGEMPFAVLDKHTGEIIGSTRYCNVEETHQRLEIGSTWYAQRKHRTAANTECKYLLLSHAFEALEAIAVEFRTHWHNRVSRAAIERLGAKQDGILRNHRRGADGAYRDTVVYSIIALEWPAVKQSLEFALARHEK